MQTSRESIDTRDVAACPSTRSCEAPQKDVSGRSTTTFPDSLLCERDPENVHAPSVGEDQVALIVLVPAPVEDPAWPTKTETLSLTPLVPKLSCPVHVPFRSVDAGSVGESWQATRATSKRNQD